MNEKKIFYKYRFISHDRIEEMANNIIEKYKLKFPIDPTYVAEKLDLDTDIIEFPSSGQEQIIAMLSPLEKKIIINENHTNDKQSNGFEQSSIAHEIGHWLLHVNHQVVEEYQVQQKQRQGLQPLQMPKLHRSFNDDENRKIEYQAQYFASCLLMPKTELKKSFYGRKLTNWQHLYAIADDFNVTISNLTNRLKTLGYIQIPRNSRKIYLKHKILNHD